MRARFDCNFSRVTGFARLDPLLRRLRKQTADLLRGLDRPEIPLRDNSSENDIRAVVTKRKVSSGTIGEVGRQARDVLLGLMKTCRKLGASFCEYLGCRLGVQRVRPVPPLEDLVRAAVRRAPANLPRLLWGARKLQRILALPRGLEPLFSP